MSDCWWEDKVKIKKHSLVLKLEGPPCSSCLYWKPLVNYRNRLATEDPFPTRGRKAGRMTLIGNWEGVTFCHAPDQMYSDFSCYESKKEEEAI